jgi:hypothetical protein
MRLKAVVHGERRISFSLLTLKIHLVLVLLMSTVFSGEKLLISNLPTAALAAPQKLNSGSCDHAARREDQHPACDESRRPVCTESRWPVGPDGRLVPPGRQNWSGTKETCRRT